MCTRQISGAKSVFQELTGLPPIAKGECQRICTGIHRYSQDVNKVLGSPAGRGWGRPVRAMTRRRYSFPRYRRVLDERRFGEIFEAGCSAADRHLVIYAAPNGLADMRLGLAVGLKHGGAVQRNRIKRRLREAFRHERSELPAGYDLVCVPRVGSVTSLALLRKSLRLVGARAIARCPSSK